MQNSHAMQMQNELQSGMRSSIVSLLQKVSQPYIFLGTADMIHSIIGNLP